MTDFAYVETGLSIGKRYWDVCSRNCPEAGVKFVTGSATIREIPGDVTHFRQFASRAIFVHQNRNVSEMLPSSMVLRISYGNFSKTLIIDLFVMRTSARKPLIPRSRAMSMR